MVFFIISCVNCVNISTYLRIMNVYYSIRCRKLLNKSDLEAIKGNQEMKSTDLSSNIRDYIVSVTKKVREHIYSETSYVNKINEVVCGRRRRVIVESSCMFYNLR